jgi:protein-tyrosine phosphatase
MEILSINEGDSLFLSSDIDDWATIMNLGISVIIDLDGGLDIGVPTIPNQMLYIYFPFYDGDLPDLGKLHAVARLGASLVEGGHKVLCHCLMGFNRSALVAGLILVYLGITGEEAVRQLRMERPGTLYNEIFADYLRASQPLSGANTQDMRS